MGLNGEARNVKNALADVSERGETGDGRGVSSREAIAEALLDFLFRNCNKESGPNNSCLNKR